MAVTAILTESLSKLVQAESNNALSVKSFAVIYDALAKPSSLALTVETTADIHDARFSDVVVVIRSLLKSVESMKYCKKIQLVVPDLHLDDPNNIDKAKLTFDDIGDMMFNFVGNGVEELSIGASSDPSTWSNSYGLRMIVHLLGYAKTTLAKLTLRNVNLDDESLKILCSEFLRGNFVLESLDISDNPKVSKSAIHGMLLPCLRLSNSVKHIHVDEAHQAEVLSYNISSNKRDWANVIVCNGEKEATDEIVNLLRSTITFPTPTDHLIPESELDKVSQPDIEKFHCFWTYNVDNRVLKTSVIIVGEIGPDLKEYTKIGTIDVTAKYRNKQEIAELRRDAHKMFLYSNSLLTRPKRIMYTSNLEGADPISLSIINAMKDTASQWCKEAFIDIDIISYKK